jgi:cation diffusion facilitator CzcD-associated flavoprotein CzcO
MSQNVDVVVIGAGHNGMTAANYLARAGRGVIVVEALAKVGGMTSSGYMIPEAPRHLVTPCARSIPIRPTPISIRTAARSPCSAIATEPRTTWHG